MGLNLIKGSNGSGEAVKASVTVPRVSGSTVLTVDSAANWPSTFIATMGTPAANDRLTAAVVFTGHISAGTIVIDSRAPGYGGTDLGSLAGDVVVLKPTTLWANNIASTMLASHNDDGTINTAGITQVTTALNNQSIRNKPRISVGTSSATLAPNTDSFNIYELSAQATALTIANPTGTPNDGDVIILRLKDNGTTRAISYGTNYTNISGLDTPTTTVVNKWMVFGWMYNLGLTKWQLVTTTVEA